MLCSRRDCLPDHRVDRDDLPPLHSISGSSHVVGRFLGFLGINLQHHPPCRDLDLSPTWRYISPLLQDFAGYSDRTILQKPPKPMS